MTSHINSSFREQVLRYHLLVQTLEVKNLSFPLNSLVTRVPCSPVCCIYRSSSKPSNLSAKTLYFAERRDVGVLLVSTVPRLLRHHSCLSLPAQPNSSMLAQDAFILSNTKKKILKQQLIGVGNTFWSLS